jgi:hypothetical protein
MAYKVVIRGGKGRQGGTEFKTAVRTVEKLIKLQYQDVWKHHIQELEEVAEYIEEDAHMLVPKDTGKLDASIDVRVSKSNRYPGVIAHAYANSGGKPGPGGYRGYDYALKQETEERYSHMADESAHYLGGPFTIHIMDLYMQLTGKRLQVSPMMIRAANWVKDKI